MRKKKKEEKKDEEEKEKEDEKCEGDFVCRKVDPSTSSLSVKYRLC